MKRACEFAVRKLAKNYERSSSIGNYMPAATMFMFLKILISEFAQINVGIQKEDTTGLFIFVVEPETGDTLYSTCVRDAGFAFGSNLCKPNFDHLHENDP